MQAERTRTDWFTWHIRQAPFQIMHLRELVENTIRAQDTEAVRVDGTTDKSRPPMNIDAADDADLLYANLIIFGREVAEHIGGASPRPLREQMWTGQTEPQGLPVCTPSEAFSHTTQISQWLAASAHTIVHTPELTDSIEHVCELIRKTRARYPTSEPQFKAYRPRPCPICDQRTILPVWGANGLEAMKCDTCGQTWASSRYSPTDPTTPTGRQPPESDETPTASNDGDVTDSP